MTDKQSKSDDARLEGEVPVAKRRRERRGWGPFSGGQLAAIIIAIVVMVMLPVGAWAVSGTSVFVTDAVNGTHATVIPTGQLNVAEAAPRNFVTGAVDPGSVGSGFWPVLTADSSHAIVVTSIEVDVYQDATPGPAEAIGLALSKTNASCASIVLQNSYIEAVVNPATIGETVLPFQPGIAIPAGRSLCAATSDATHINAEVHAFGYKIAAASGPTPAAVVPRTGNPAFPPSVRKR